MASTALSDPLRHTPLQMVAGWLPSGFMSTDSLRDVVSRAVPGRWVEHPNYWAVACDYESGRRTPFGRLGSPRAEIGDAVAASCAIPGFFRPVKINGRRYVDGGVCSVSNMDLVAGRGLDLVICLNPLSTGTDANGETATRPGPGPLGRLAPLDPRDWLGALSRGANGRRLAHELGKVRHFGTEVVLVEPTPADHAVMGRNLMSTARRQQVIETAEQTVLEQLRRPDTQALLRDLPKGEPHKIRRPSGPPTSWPSLAPAVKAGGSRAA
jgi:NTE family protein